ncbi:MAG TPA: hypothetical protein VMB21_12055 [Candidatus Limnocylindria bacterium]|jgi:hypothetical protein|nr:hypothetical protein [Candidatus Limnocylindria bacterium]
MPSVTEPAADLPDAPRNSRWRVRLERWNRRLHYFSGLFLLLFLWLFAVTGLILNHPGWSFAESWTNRTEKSEERVITAPGPEVPGDLGQARDIMRQLGIEGDILWTTTRTDPAQFDFQVRRPGHYYFIKADLARQRAILRDVKVNLWGVLKVLHVFSGVQLDDPRQTRDWWLTTVWACSMDAVAAGLIFMVLSSLYMWYELPPKRLPGAIVLGVGTLICGLFCLGLQRMY